jgi:hypothetical protein
VEIGAEAALFPEKEYINGIAVAVWMQRKIRHNVCRRHRWLFKDVCWVTCVICRTILKTVTQERVLNGLFKLLSKFRSRTIERIEPNEGGVGAGRGGEGTGVEGVQSCNRFLLAVPLIQSSGYSFFYRCFGGINIPHTRTQYTHASTSSLPVPD